MAEKKKAPQVALVEAFLQRLIDADVDAIADILTEDAVFEFPFAPEGQPKAIKGRDGIAAYFRKTFPKKRITAVTRCLTYEMADPSTVFQEFDCALLDVETGARHDNNYCALYDLRDGKIALFREYYNSVVRQQKEGVHPTLKAVS
ncbi:MAG: nuclear transport factor 2 family protein [Roseitalea sp.]|jgi:ketosteroid isomerase-like protein|nr:nuclear transport factor 2 family protein [Roseitalea sp.]MBO6722052.1 nuclear transport factor 2 family protein [Roseitalea sp.]MBO6741672.1 nuclear transport factor 2 family protein [Roseitalea sp.]